MFILECVRILLKTILFIPTIILAIGWVICFTIAEICSWSVTGDFYTDIIFEPIVWLQKYWNKEIEKWLK